MDACAGEIQTKELTICAFWGMKYILLLICLLSASPLFSQQPDGDQIMGGAYTVLRQRPKFNGNLFSYIKKHTHYPNAQKKYDTEGVTDVRFIVNEDGSISDIEIMRSLGMDFDNETIKLIKQMPKWKPGMKDGHPVRAWVNFGVLYELHK